MQDLTEYNRDAWDRAVAANDRWTIPVSAEEVARARTGDVRIVLTPTRLVPSDWLGELAGRDVLGLASGGGQQCPLMAAAGARVTLIDNSPAQLAQDRLVAEREGLEIRTVHGDMRDLSRFEEASFDLVFHPVSNCFVDNVLPVWREAFRVLRPGGILLAGVVNPISYAIDPDLAEKGVVQLRYSIPYSDIGSLTDEERARYTDAGEPLEFGHTLEDLIGGQLAAGFVLTGFFEDIHGPPQPLERYLAPFIATRALKPLAGVA